MSNYTAETDSQTASIVFPLRYRVSSDTLINHTSLSMFCSLHISIFRIWQLRAEPCLFRVPHHPQLPVMESRYFFWDRDIGQDRGIETWDEPKQFNITSTRLQKAQYFLSTACYFILCMYSFCLFLLQWFVFILCFLLFAAIWRIK